MDPPPLPTPHSNTSQTSSSSTKAKANTTITFPRLTVLDPSKPHTFLRPAKRINDGPDVARFLTCQAYRDIGIFILQLNRALCPRVNTTTDGLQNNNNNNNNNNNSKNNSKNNSNVQTFPLGDARREQRLPPSVTRLQALLARLDAMIDEAPPDPGPRRFGNFSFRRWHALLEQRIDDLLEEYIAPGVLLRFGGGGGQAENPDPGPGRREEAGRQEQERGEEDQEGPALLLDELKAYFLGGFGSAQRLDYGTGHELSFLAFLGCLWKLGAFQDGESESGEMERNVVLGIFEPYLKVVRRLILTYTLEPAGSRGAWGLDDHSFLPYIFGSAQLTRPISSADDEPMPQEGSVPRAPRPSDVTKAAAVERLRGENMYFSAIGFINDVKKGPFWEHSHILFNISGILDGWGKINKGMIKMFNAEVLAKFPVVQHFPFGSLFSWDQDPDAVAPVQTVHMASQPVGTATATTSSTAAVGTGTAAPWAQATAMPHGVLPTGPGIPFSRVPAVTSGGSNAPSAFPRRTGGTVPDTGPPPPTVFPRGRPGTASNQISVTKAPWAKE